MRRTEQRYDGTGGGLRRTAARRVARGLAAAALAVAAAAPQARASTLLPPHIGGRDTAMGGNVVATPLDGPSILLHNPAGVVGGTGTEVMSSLITATMGGRYANPVNGYDQRSSETPFAPVLWVRSDRLAPWYVGAGIYGTVGSSFSFAPQPGAGVPDPYCTELGLAQLGLVVGREILPNLRFGLQAAPSWGSIRTRTPTPFGTVHFDIDGFGIVGAAGLLFDLSSRTTVGLSYRSPGVVYMRGTGTVAGAHDSVSINLHVPQNVIAGIAHRLTPRLLATVQVTWTDYPEFENGEFQFKRQPLLNQPFIAGARHTVRYGAGLEYDFADWIRLRSGFSREEWMMEPSALSPLLYDATDTAFGIGIGISHGPWTFDFNTGLALMEDRVVTTAHQQAFPGRYEMDSSPGVNVAVTRRFGDAPARGAAE